VDSITHIVLGATIGELMLGKKIGKRALVVGAVAQSVPDIDFLAAFWLSPAENLIAHRGFTHSFLFAGIASLLLALLVDRWHRRQTIFFNTWWLFMGVQISIHLLIDGFNSYGVGWLEPFSLQRFSFNTLFVADPFFSLGVAGAVGVLIFLPSDSSNRIRWATIGLGISAVYLVYSVVNKINIDRLVVNELRMQGFTADRYFTTPTPLNIWLWYVVAEDNDGFRVAYLSVFDNHHGIDFEYFPKNDSLLIHINDHEALQRLKRFSQGYYTVNLVNDTLVFSDLRFGQAAGWHNPRAPFVFQYYLQHPADNKLVIQRGRFANWNKETIRSLWWRIKGKK
jgi:inner membrane protein